MPTSPFLGITEVTPSQSAKETTINNAIEALEAAENATLAVSFASGDVTLSVTQFTRNFIFKATGATADHILNIPATVNSAPTSRVFAVRNASGHNITVQVTGAPGTTVVIPTGTCHLLNVDGAGNVAIVAAPPSFQTFLGLSDVPAAYTGAGKKIVRVKATADGLEFVALALSDLADVDMTTTAPTNGQVPVWDSTAGKWKPGTVVSGGGGATTLDGLTDVDTSTVAPTDKQILIYDAGTSLWKPGSRALRITAFATTAPTTSEVISMFIADVAFVFAANFSGSQAKVGTNPTATFVFTVFNGSTSIGTISISTGGVVTFATTSGTSKNVAAGDVIKVVAQSTTDATIANFVANLVGTY